MSDDAQKQSAPGVWYGRVRMGLGWGWFQGAVGDPAAHAHYAIQLVLSDRPVPVWTTSDGWQPRCAVLLGPSLMHALGRRDEAVTLVYLEPDSGAGRRIRQLLRNGVAELTHAQQVACRAALAARPQAPDEALADSLVPNGLVVAGRCIDPRIDALLDGIDARLDDAISTARLAAAAGMSVSHFQHRFRAQTGMPVRPYLRWRRLLRAMHAVLSGASLTDAALQAGFADAAHFTRTMRRHFGITPRTLAAMAASADRRFVQDAS